jgi:hypothetical protein
MPARIVLVAMTAMFLIVSCGRVPVPVPKLPERRPDTMSVTIMAEDEANAGSVTPVDVVFADAEAVDALDGLTAQDWFSRRARIEQEFGDALFVRQYQVSPGTATSAEFEELDDAAAVFVFAGYATGGEHAYRLEPADDYFVRLGADGFTAETR